MKKIITLLLVVLPIVVFAQSKNNVFNAKSTIVNASKGIEPKVIKGKLVNIDVMGAVGIQIIDSLLVFRKYKSDNFIDVYNLKDNQLLGNFILKGKGHNEFLNLNNIYRMKNTAKEFSIYFSASINKNSDSDKRWIRKFMIPKDFNYENSSITTYIDMLKYNIKSKKEIVYGHSIQHANLLTFSDLKLLDDSRFLIYGYPQLKKDDDKYGFQIVNYKNNMNVVKSKQLFSVSPLKNRHFLNETKCVVRSDGKKMAMFMVHYNQANFIDLVGDYDISVTTDKEFTTKPEGLNPYGNNYVDKYTLKSKDYYAIQIEPACNNKYVVAAYFNNSNVRIDNPAFVSYHIFDWNGKLMGSIKLNEKVRSIALDNNNKLYGLTIDEELYIYDITSVLSSKR